MTYNATRNMTTNKVIDLRSDTVTLPTEEMLDAIRTAPLGDDVWGDDPTVNQLEALAAARVGKEAALLAASGTMGNLISLMAYGGHGNEALVDEDAHIYWYEQGALCSVAGYTPGLIPSTNGLMDPADVEAAIRTPNIHYPVPRLFCLENTHNRGGGRVIPPALFRDLCAVARRHDMKIHLDGARVFNAAVAADVDVREFTEPVDSVQFCLSKGLSAPIGSIVAGDAAFVDRARRARKRVGGGMRQAGIIAACGIVALETMVDRLAEDHANAARLAELVEGLPGLQVAMKPVETNMVFVDLPEGQIASDAAEALRRQGLLVSSPGPSRLRLVTNRLVSRDDVEDAGRILAEYAAA